MDIIDEFRKEQARWVEIRHDIHAHPETAFEENRTSDLVAQLLAAWGIEVHRHIGKTGVVGVLHGHLNDGSKTGKRCLGLRADMDALPMPELNRFAYASQVPGQMHACGHDGHTTILLAAAHYLSSHREFDGTVYFIFQPAEEGGNGGARMMMQEGLFERFPCDEIYGLHNMPGLPVGTLNFRPGALMASSNRFTITVHGIGGHAAMPHKTVDPIIIATEIIGALQTVISRHKNPDATAVLSVTQIHAGDAFNVIPNEAVIKGTVRTFDTETLDLIEGKIRQIVKTLPQVHGGKGLLDFVRSYPVLMNWEAQTDFAASVAESMLGKERVRRDTPRLSGAEDFSFYLQKCPGSYFFLGNGDGEHRTDTFEGMGPCELHNPSYDFNDALIPIGAAYWVRLAQAFFSQTRP